MYFLKKTHGTKKGWCDWFVWATAKLIMEAAANSLKIVCRNKCCRGKRVINKKKKKKTVLALQLESSEKQKQDSKSNSKTTQRSSYLPPDNCRYCKKSRHWKRNCPALKRKEGLRPL